MLSVAHSAAVPFERVASIADTKQILPVTAAGPLRCDYADIIALAVDQLRAAYRARPAPFRLLTVPFTMRMLHQLHEVISGERLIRDAFRRFMEPQLEETGELYRGGLGKPARVFAIRG